jgi:putative selenium metabolism protein SsnA
MALILENALLCDLDPIRVEPGALRLEAGTITERGAAVTRQPGDEVVDCGGAVVLPGLVNGHTHLYSALAAGMPMPAKMPGNFHEILKFIWWRLDRALDEESIEFSAAIGALDALHCGTTTLIDHHASPECIEDSLDLMEKGIGETGLRGVLCYEITDRNGRAGRDAGLAENARYLKKGKTGTRARGRFAGMVGAHAPFTMDDDTLAATASLAREHGVGVHIHVAEDPCDNALCEEHFGQAVVARLDAHGLFSADNIIGHGTHLSAEGIEKLRTSGAALAHNPRSNMNNSVGYTPLAKHRGLVMLGTDGIGADMFTEARHAWFKQSDAKQGLSPARILELLANSARRASRSLGVTLGKLQPGAAADVVITDYRPATPLTTENFAGHFIFALGPQHVKDVIANGAWALKNRVATFCDEPQIRQKSIDVARRLWSRMEQIPLD